LCIEKKEEEYERKRVREQKGGGNYSKENERV
jgi:hypothetical protein